MRELYPNLARLGCLGLLLVMGGCASATRLALPGPFAHVIVANLSDCEWRIAIASSDGGAVRTVQLPARGLRNLELPGGDYIIEQTMLAGDPESIATRRLTAKFDPGQTYRWRLVTLLSVPTRNLGRQGGELGRE